MVGRYLKIVKNQILRLIYICQKIWPLISYIKGRHNALYVKSIWQKPMAPSNFHNFYRLKASNRFWRMKQLVKIVIIAFRSETFTMVLYMTYILDKTNDLISEQFWFKNDSGLIKKNVIVPIPIYLYSISHCINGIHSSKYWSK